MLDGSVKVYLCPSPSKTAAASSAAAAGAAAVSGGGFAPVLDLAPLVVLALAGPSLTCISWHPTDPTQLLCGATDGSVCLWRLPTYGGNGCGGEEPAPLTTPARRYVDMTRDASSAGDCVLRAVEWCPFEPRLFAAAGQQTAAVVWHVDDQFRPIV
ncbi:unnamed protein product, partial [Phaeothamnion confervicola]